MSIIKHIIYAILALNISGCGGDQEEKEVAQYDIYWSSSVEHTGINGTYTDSGIYGARRGTFDQATKIIDLNTSILSCAVDEKGNIYWGDRDHKAIFKADKNGGNIRAIVTGLDIPMGLAVDNTNKKLYWSNWLQSNAPQSGEIGYADLDGSNQSIIVTTGLSSGGFILLDSQNSKLYIADLFGSKIVKTSLNGHAFQVVATTSQPGQLDIDYKNGRLIWTDLITDNILSANFNGTDMQEIIAFNDPFANPEALSIDQTNNTLYFVSFTGLTAQADIGYEVLESSNLDGTNVKTVNTNMKAAVRSLWTVQ
jgi:hypothetical protein